jgi:catechol 2,3-dioxygenase-like lactoylglutathione lyase family enzyme
MSPHGADIDRTAEWEAMRVAHLRAPDERPPTSARVHQFALLSLDVERTIAFYQDLLEFPLTELFENRRYQGSTHFFFDIGNGNLLAFFDFPGPRPRALRRVLGDASPRDLGRAGTLGAPCGQARAAGVPTHRMSGSSPYFSGPDGERLSSSRTRSVRCTAPPSPEPSSSQRRMPILRCGHRHRGPAGAGPEGRRRPERLRGGRP